MDPKNIMNWPKLNGVHIAGHHSLEYYGLLPITDIDINEMWRQSTSVDMDIREDAYHQESLFNQYAQGIPCY
jgi:hypothetical protein